LLLFALLIVDLVADFPDATAAFDGLNGLSARASSFPLVAETLRRAPSCFPDFAGRLGLTPLAIPSLLNANHKW